MSPSVFLNAISGLTDNYAEHFDADEMLSLMLAFVYAQNAALHGDDPAVFDRAADLATQLAPIPDRLN